MGEQGTQREVLWRALAERPAEEQAELRRRIAQELARDLSGLSGFEDDSEELLEEVWALLGESGWEQHLDLAEDFARVNQDDVEAGRRFVMELIGRLQKLAASERLAMPRRARALMVRHYLWWRLTSDPQIDEDLLPLSLAAAKLEVELETLDEWIERGWLPVRQTEAGLMVDWKRFTETSPDDQPGQGT